MAYATVTDLYRVGVQAASVANVGTPALEAALEAASSLADGYIRSTETPTPLVAPYPPELTLAVAKIAAFDILSVRGFRPDSGDEVFVKRHDDAIAWLRDISRGVVSLSIANVSPTAPVYPTPIVSTTPKRGW